MFKKNGYAISFFGRGEGKGLIFEGFFFFIVIKKDASSGNKQQYNKKAEEEEERKTAELIYLFLEHEKNGIMG